jgi:hypothetical protein
MQPSPLSVENLVGFLGESSWDIIIRHKNLDLEEKYTFRSYVIDRGTDPDSATLHELEEIYLDWTAFDV